MDSNQESEGPIVISNMDQFDMKEVSMGAIGNDHEDKSSKSYSQNF